jgi:hypothetical protein
MSDQTLLTLLDEIRGKTLAVLEGVNEEESRWVPSGLQNSIRWHAGHCYIVVEWLCADAVGIEPVAPDGWFELFSWESRPQTVQADCWPALALIAEQLISQRERLLFTFSRLTEAQLDVALPARRHQSVRREIVHALHDEACHCGEIWLLRKLLTRRSGGGTRRS